MQTKISSACRCPMCRSIIPQWRRWRWPYRPHVGDAAIGVVTLGILILWPRLGIRLPGHLPALLGGCAVMLVVNLLGGDVATIGSQFHYQLADGTQAMAFRSCCRSWYCPRMPGSNLP